jgi:YggT family protein
MIVHFINVVFQALILLVIVDALLSFFLATYHPIRRLLDRLVDPMLDPIRRLVPPIQGIDFSPLILIALLEFISYILIAIISSIG